MKWTKIIYSVLLIAFVTSCNKPVTRKVVIMGRGKLKVENKSISMEDGTGYAEEISEITGNEPVEWDITTPQGKTKITVPEERGVYILNLKTDTLVGSLQIVGVDLSRSNQITQEELQWKIDSLTKLTKGDNVQLGGRNYFILPRQIIKVSPNINAKIFGPFTLISNTMEVDDKNELPEIYKFYTNTEMHQLIDKFKKMTY